MSSGIKTYPNTNSGTTGHKDVTGTDVSPNKRALDIAIQESVIPSAGSILSHTQVAVLTTAQALPGAAAAFRKKIIVQNLGPDTLYLGTASVTVADGLRITIGSNLTLELSEFVDLYGISTAGGSDVRVLEIG